MACQYCEVFTENELGEQKYRSLPSVLYKVTKGQPRPYLLKTNNRWFLIVDGFKPIRIKVCPICGRTLDVDPDEPITFREPRRVSERYD